MEKWTAPAMNLCPLKLRGWGLPAFALGLVIALTGCNKVVWLNSPIQPSTDPDQQADLLLSKMTQAQKLQRVHGNVPLPPNPTPPPRGAPYWVPGIAAL